MKIGINAMSSISAMQKDFEGCLKRLKEGGCDYIEGMSDWGARQETIDLYAGLTGGPSGWDMENTVSRIEKINEQGMSFEGMFVFSEILEAQAEDLGIYCEKNNIGYIVLSFLEYGNIDDIYDKIGLIKKVSHILRKYHVQMLIHNHEHDSNIVTDRDGQNKSILQIFLEQCSPDELMLETDTGWLLYAGEDEVEYVRRYLDRIAVLHLKDIHKDYKTLPREDIFLPCGQGAVRFPEIIEIAKTKPSMIYILDQDSSKGDIIEDNIESIHYIRSLFYGD